MGGQRGQRLGFVLSGAHVLEPPERRAEDAAASELGPHLGLHRPEVLPDDEGALAAGLDGDDVEQFGGGEPHVGTTLGPGARRQPELAEEAHHVVDAQTTRVDEHGSDRIPERLEAGRPQLPGHVGGQPPVLPLGSELVGRCPDPARERQQVLVVPGVEAAGVEADRQVLEHGDRTLGRGAQLLVHEPLAPGMEAQPVGAEGQRLLGDRGARRVLELGRPCPPRRAVDLGEDAVPGPVLEAQGPERPASDGTARRRLPRPAR